jgi:hypothetical protein
MNKDFKIVRINEKEFLNNIEIGIIETINKINEIIKL